MQLSIVVQIILGMRSISLLFQLKVIKVRDKLYPLIDEAVDSQYCC